MLFSSMYGVYRPNSFPYLELMSFILVFILTFAILRYLRPSLFVSTSYRCTVTSVRHHVTLNTSVMYVWRYRSIQWAHVSVRDDRHRSTKWRGWNICVCDVYRHCCDFLYETSVYCINFTENFWNNRFRISKQFIWACIVMKIAYLYILG